MTGEKQIKSFILSRFYMVLAVVSVFEVAVVLLTNTYLVPWLFSNTPAGLLLSIKSVDNLFIVVFVLVATGLVNKILPIFKVSPVEVNQFLVKLLADHGMANSDVKGANTIIESLSSDTKASVTLLLSVLLIALVLILPYIVGGIIYSVSIARRIRKLEREKEAARRREEKRRYLMISNIVHDLKTPMTTVYGYAKALNDGIVPAEKQPEYHEAIMAKTERMNEIALLLLDYVKLDSEGFTIKKDLMDICELVRSCCALCYTDVESAGDEIDISIPEKPLLINGDSVQLKRVITNLIMNAIRHNPEGTKIGVYLKCESMTTADDIRIFVADSGPAIPSPLSEQIFEPFVTGDESRTSGSGTGLGLAISARICEMHDFNLKLVQKPEIFRYHLDDAYTKVFVVAI
ncbi:MAG: HAMP domain-containing histidine kinase [Saccharofermentans sp.]|nr:HAMP domain-containing histidine kinase [Saccharofermentans sp.]